MDDVTEEVAAATRYSLLALAACADFVVQRAYEGDEAAGRLLALLHDAERRSSVASLEADIAMPSSDRPRP